MNPVESVLLQNIDKSASCFIFPTDIAASRWADRLLRLRGGAIPMNKFIAWDVFKQNSIKSKVQNKKSIPSVLRKIFTGRLVVENAERIRQGKEPIFTSLVQSRWADQASQFVPWLTDLLPQLGSWFNKATGLSPDAILSESAKKAAAHLKGDNGDMYALASRYAQFLEEHGLFEPAWETPPFNDDGKECFIFYPESLSDYCEYKLLLSQNSNVKTISVPDTENYPCDAFFYTNARCEITEAALYIRALHEKQNVDWDAIAVCIPDLENYEAYVLREFSNRNIPFVKRTSKPLSDYPAGQFFKSVMDCTSRDFAFSSLVSLVLNKNLPWKDTKQIDNLVDFGINNNCISSWKENEEKEKNVNVWEDAFRQPFKYLDPESEKFFNELKRRLHSMRAAPSFAEVRRQYFIFRQRFFDMTQCAEETDLILSRCISELMYLVEIEKAFPDAPAADPFLFFTEYLNEVNYLAQTRALGVNILPYKTAAAAPFDCHIILGAGQEEMSVIFSRLGFLPRKEREKLGIFDEDASLSFINMHKANSLKNAAIFCSELSFSGYTVPHSKTGSPAEPRDSYAQDPALCEKFSQDYYGAESSFFSSLDPGKDPPEKLHDNQIHGYENWKSRRNADTAASVVSFTDKILLENIRKRYIYSDNYPDLYSVSSSSLKTYYQCSLKWLFEHVLSVENVQIETSLMAENIAGNVCHAVLYQFLSAVKKSKKPLSMPVITDRAPALPSGYDNLLKESIDAVFSAFPYLQAKKQNDGDDEIFEKRPQMSALTARLLYAEKNHFYFILEKCLTHFLSLFAGCKVTDCEKSYQAKRDKYYLNGTLDCILELPPASDKKDAQEKSKYTIVDFKLKNLPVHGDCTTEEENALCDFQLPMYITLTEENLNIEIDTALFFSILLSKPEVIIGSVEDVITHETVPKKEDSRILRGSELYKNIFTEFSQKTKKYTKEISTGKFSVFETDFKNCNDCEYNRICRTVYIINREKTITPGLY